MQTFTSSATSINRSRLPAVYRKADLTSGLVFDYGCGKYTDHIEAYVKAPHRVYLPYDPFNQPDDVNKFSVTLVLNAMHIHYPVDVVCSNVLNVIDSEAEISRICHHIEEIATTTGGTGYVTVYEGNSSGIGRQTGRDQYQRNEPLRDYLRFFHNATIRNGMIIVNGGTNK
jgi:hypothetical protein